MVPLVLAGMASASRRQHPLMTAGQREADGAALKVASAVRFRESGFFNLDSPFPKDVSFHAEVRGFAMGWPCKLSRSVGAELISS